MRIGLKDRRVVFQQPVANPGTYGDAKPTYTTVITVWASVEPLRGDERFKAMQIQAEVSHRIRVRYSASLAAINPKWRCQLGGRVLDILSVVDINEQHRELELLCRERV